jgi:phosphoribosylamine--glycine ligase
VDEFEARGLRIVGPRREAARLEASKAFAKDFMGRHQIPTARYRIASSRDEARSILASGEFGDENSPVVIKADGLAAGKGVIVARSRLEAQQAVDDLILGADGASRILIEETLVGREASLLLFSDGRDFRLMPAARDHKRIGENDTGPNTGGMGAVTDPNVLDQATLDVAIKKIVKPTLQGARDEGYPFRGVLFIGLMLTNNGPKVLEYNVRFGDPETQAILVRLKSDLVNVFEAICDRRLAEIDVKWSNESSACIVLAAPGYPGKAETGARIEGLDRARRHENVSLFHAATSRGDDGGWITAGGRVLGVTATGMTLETALSRAYAAVAEIRWEGMQYRRDIGRPEAPQATSGG